MALHKEPYGSLGSQERDEIVATLCDDWTKDWGDGFGARPDGSMVWQVNAVDLMLLVSEIARLRERLDDIEDRGRDFPI